LPNSLQPRKDLKKSHLNLKVLQKYGWHEYFENSFRDLSYPDYSPVRVILQNKTNYGVVTAFGEMTAELTGKFYFEHDTREQYPIVGDWAAARILQDEKKAFIDKVLPRRTKISRKVSGVKSDEQLIAANVDVAFIMTSLNHDINIRRLERYLVLCNDSAIKPVVLLTKADLCSSAFASTDTIKKSFPSTAVHTISVLKDYGLSGVLKYFKGNKTITLLGSSGVGKSTLINKLCPGADIKVNEIRDYKDKGKHTTTRRELFVLPSGGMIIDNPGMRELQLWDSRDGLSEVFADIEKYVSECRFSDCKHDSEPGCAVNEAIEKGMLDEAKYKSYLKLQRELSYQERKQDLKANLLEKKRWKKLTSEAKKRSREKQSF
jgi:ribosome biogenesis GTPase / thiamine phosphate phosphatase